MYIYTYSHDYIVTKSSNVAFLLPHLGQDWLNLCNLLRSASDADCRLQSSFVWKAGTGPKASGEALGALRSVTAIVMCHSSPDWIRLTYWPHPFWFCGFLWLMFFFSNQTPLKSFTDRHRYRISSQGEVMWTFDLRLSMLKQYPLHVLTIFTSQSGHCMIVSTVDRQQISV